MEEAGVQFCLGQPMRGWLRRQGGKMRGWQRKFFELKDGCLFCFNREDDIQLAGTYLLHGYQLKDVPANLEDPDKFAFELVKEKNNGDSSNSITLSAASDTEKKEWMKALCYHLYAGKGGAMFGLPLEEAMKYEHSHGRSVPYIVEACVQHLERFALETEGIFRVAGRAGLLRELRGQFEMGQQPALDDVDVHTVGSLLKLYLRELPESLVPPDLYQRIMNCAMRHAEASSNEARETEVLCLSKLLEEVPDINYATLAYICRFLHRLAANAEKTKMTVHNLSLVFGPNLIRHLDSSPELLMLTADLTQQLAFMMITHCPQVLPSRPEREAVPKKSTSAKNAAAGSVATGDLLRMSRPLDAQDVALLVPRPSALRDLMGLELVPQHGDGAERSHSPVSPLSPFTFINDYFDRTDKSVSEKREEVRSSEAAGTSEKRPVAPRRTKSRSMRNRRSAGTPSSPMTPDSPRQLDSQDILAALASVSLGVAAASHGDQEIGDMKEPSDKFPSLDRNTPMLPADDGGDGNSERSDSPGYLSKSNNTTAVSVLSSNNGACNGDSSTVEVCQKAETDAGYGTDTGRIRPSNSVLEAQITALQTELAGIKARSERMVAALKSQLTDIQSKYEARITSLQGEQRREVMGLMAKLDAERTARAEAVEKTVSLQAQLYKYKLQYGELP